MDWYNKTETIDTTVSKLYERFRTLEKQKEDIVFYEDAVIDKFISSIQNEMCSQFPFNSDFFKSLLNKEHEKHKSSIDWTLRELKTCLSNKIKKIDDFICCGFEMYGVGVYFTLNKKKYELVIPVKQNISRRNTVFEENGRMIIDWDMGKLRLLEQDSKYEHSWNTIWCGYDLNDCKVFKEEGE